MSISLAANPARTAPKSWIAAYATVAAVTFSAAAGAPTPIYRLYRESLGLSPLIVTSVFAIYSITMVAAFLTVARLSDYVGRKIMALLSLALNALAMLLFFVSVTGAELLAARAVQGVATGIALATFGAMISDAAPTRAAVLNSVTAFVGLASGALLSGALVAYGPWPEHLVFALLFAITVAEMAPLVFLPETVTRKSGALRALIPTLALPRPAAAAMMRLFPLTLAAWALGGFYLSQMPSLVIATTGLHYPLVGAGVVAALMAAGGFSAVFMMRVEASRAVRLSSLLLALGIAFTVAAIALGSPIGMLLGTIVAGVGFGGSYGAALRALLPLVAPHERAGLLSAYFVESYLAFALPAVGAGVAAPHFGLAPTAIGYGSLLALSAFAALVLEWRAKNSRAR